MNKLIPFLIRRYYSFVLRLRILLKAGYIPFSTTIDVYTLDCISFGRSVRIGAFSRITVDPGATLHIGSHVTTGRQLTLYCKESVYIGDNCRFAHSVTISDAKYKESTQDPRSYSCSLSAPITINSNCLIYTGAIILMGARIPAGSTVVAYALVTKSIDPDQPSIIYGSPRLTGFRPI